MNFHQLEIFYAVAQRASITAAASDLRLTQPAVSLQIKALENWLEEMPYTALGLTFTLRTRPPIATINGGRWRGLAGH